MSAAVKDPPAETRKAEMPMEFRAAPVASFNAEARTVEVVWTTGAKVRRRRFDWGGGRFVEYDESLEVTKAAVDMSRLAAGAAALDSHGLHSTREQVGVVEKAWLANGKGRAVIRFPKVGIDENADRVAALVADGIIRNVSVGYSVDRIRVVAPKNDNDVEQRIVERWTPYELSFVTIGADPGAQVRGADHDETRTFPVEIVRAPPGKVKETDMNTRTADPGAQRDFQTNPLQGEELNAFIRNMAKRNNVDEKFVADLIAKNPSDREAREALFDELARRDAESVGHTELSEDGLTRRGHGSLDDPEFRLRAMQGALVEKMLPRRLGYRPPDGAEAYRSYETLAAFARDICERERISTRGLSDGRILDKARQVRSAGVGYGAMGTGDFSTLLGGAAEQHVLQRFLAAPSPLEALGEQRQFADFREQNFVHGSAFPELDKVNEHGEITSGTLADSGQKITAATYGKIVGLTRQAQINANSIGLFADLMNNAAEAAMALKAKLMATAFETNPVLADNIAVFHADHGNLAGAGGAPDETRLSAARVAMRKQTGPNGERISPIPKYLVVPSELETTAEKLVSTIQATTTEDANVFTKLVPLVEPRLTDATAWYIAADPATALGFIFGYVGDQTGPMVDMQEGWRIDGTEFRVRMDFAAGFVDYRPFYKNPGQ